MRTLTTLFGLSAIYLFFKGKKGPIDTVIDAVSEATQTNTNTPSNEKDGSGSLTSKKWGELTTAEKTGKYGTDWLVTYLFNRKTQNPDDKKLTIQKAQAAARTVGKSWVTVTNAYEAKYNASYKTHYTIPNDTIKWYINSQQTKEYNDAITFNMWLMTA